MAYSHAYTSYSAASAYSGGSYNYPVYTYGFGRRVYYSSGGESYFKTDVPPRGEESFQTGYSSTPYASSSGYPYSSTIYPSGSYWSGSHPSGSYASSAGSSGSGGYS